MYISKQTIEWLRNHSHSDNRIYIHENRSNIEMMFAMDALRHDLIEPERPVGKDQWLEDAQEYMEVDAFAYRLTLTGEAVLAEAERTATSEQKLEENTMFIKIGNFIINSDNILRIWKDDMGVDLDFNVHDEGNDEPLSMRITVRDPYHPEALAAYDWFCKAAIRFDGSPAPQAEAEHRTAEDGVLGTFVGVYHGYEIRRFDTRYYVYNQDRVLKCTKSDLYGAKDWIDGQPETEPPAAPQPVSADAGDGNTGYWIQKEEGTLYPHIMRGDPFSKVFHNLNVYKNEMKAIADLLNQETQALRSQLHAANDKVAALEDVLRYAETILAYRVGEAEDAPTIGEIQLLNRVRVALRRIE